VQLILKCEKNKHTQNLTQQAANISFLSTRDSIFSQGEEGQGTASSLYSEEETGRECAETYLGSTCLQGHLAPEV
jgi:hypothetical protein